MTATADMSLEQQVALLPPEEQDAIIGDADPEALLWDWGWNGRPAQILPIHEGEPGFEFQTALALAGRGFGKTLMGAQWIRALDAAWATLGRDQSHMRVALVGRTAADVRDVMLEGPSGILNVYPPSARDQLIWTPSRRRLELPNGGVCLTYSAEEPSQLRGPQFHCFPAGTMVRTADGETPIEQLAVGDQVWTRAGLRPVKDTQTSVAEVATLHHERGSLTGTLDHPILTQRGWVDLALVHPSDTLVGWTTTTGSGRSTTEAGHGERRVKVAVNAFGVVTTTGRRPTGRSRQDTRSITSISTGSTMTLPTSLPSLPKPIRRSIVRPWSLGHANNAVRTSIRTLSAAMPSSALPARSSEPKRRTDGPTLSVDRTFASALIAEPLSLPAVETIAVKGVSISGHVTQVYNLTVEGQPEFFADGILTHNCGWADELAAYKQVRSIDDDATAWENLRIAVRLGTHPQILATTTPKRVPLLRQLLAESVEHPKKFLIRRGKTTDNKYLSEGYLDVLESLYGGTALGRQELEGEMLDDVAGAMTSEAIINRNRIPALPDGIPWIKLLSIDPSVAERPQDECGMVVIYISKTWPVLRRHAFIVEDLSVRASPAVWGEMAIRKATEHNAQIVVETNQGANLVFQMLRQSADALGMPMPPMKEVWATKAKAVRSEPVGGAYARGRIHHVGELFPELESQITSWVAGESGYSPDRQDALVQGCASGLFPEAITSGGMGTTVLRTVADQHIPLGRGDRRGSIVLPSTRTGYRGY